MLGRGGWVIKKRTRIVCLEKGARMKQCKLGARCDWGTDSVGFLAEVWLNWVEDGGERVCK